MNICWFISYYIIEGLCAARGRSSPSKEPQPRLVLQPQHKHTPPPTTDQPLQPQTGQRHAYIYTHTESCNHIVNTIRISIVDINWDRCYLFLCSCLLNVCIGPSALCECRKCHTKRTRGTCPICVYFLPDLWPDLPNRRIDWQGATTVGQRKHKTPSIFLYSRSTWFLCDMKLNKSQKGS